MVSLNPVREISRNRIMGEYDYDHPVFDQAAIRAQADVPQLQGRRRTWFCGAWTGYGFHEDGLKAGLEVARRLLIEIAEHAQPVPVAASDAGPVPRRIPQPQAEVAQ